MIINSHPSSHLKLKGDDLGDAEETIRPLPADIAPDESETLFRALVEISADAVIILNPAGVARYVNPAFTRLFGYTLADIPGQNPFALLHPDDVPLATTRFVTVHERGDEATPVEIRLSRSARLTLRPPASMAGQDWGWSSVAGCAR